MLLVNPELSLSLSCCLQPSLISFLGMRKGFTAAKERAHGCFAIGQASLESIGCQYLPISASIWHICLRKLAGADMRQPVHIACRNRNRYMGRFVLGSCNLAWPRLIARFAAVYLALSAIALALMDTSFGITKKLPPSACVATLLRLLHHTGFLPRSCIHFSLSRCRLQSIHK